MAEEKKQAYETRSIKRLESSKTASAYQKQWFHTLRPRTEAGEPFALVCADAPMEIFRAMDIPFVVYQWWTAAIGFPSVWYTLYQFRKRSTLLLPFASLSVKDE